MKGGEKKKYADQSIYRLNDKYENVIKQQYKLTIDTMLLEMGAKLKSIAK